MNDIDPDFMKVLFRLDPKDWHGRPSETLWAKPILRNGRADLVQLHNSPFFAKGVSFLDVVSTRNADGGTDVEFDREVECSGHSTYMLLVPQAETRFGEWWQKLSNLGCTYESKTIVVSEEKKTLYSMDVPPATDIYAVYSILEVGESENLWVFQEGHVGHKLRK